MSYKHQFLIASYAKDFVWLRQCLRSLKKFSRGFGPTQVIIPSSDVGAFDSMMTGIDIKDLSFERQILDGPGFGRAQVAMMSGDIYCPRADYYWLLGSDCFATREFSPEDYCSTADGKPVMLYNTWGHLQKVENEACFWKAGTEHALGGESHGEFMRRLPLAYPTAMMPAFRRNVVAGGGRTNPGENYDDAFARYVCDRVNRVRNFSESNVMGEYAWRYFRDAYHWVKVDKWDPAAIPSRCIQPTGLPIVQFWSHGGTKHIRAGETKTPEQVFVETLGSL